MATKRIYSTKANSADILNAVRNSASDVYKGYVPIASYTLDSIKTIGEIITGNAVLTNEFLNIMNRIGKVVITSKMWQNPWAMFSRGEMEYGETAEEIFVDAVLGKTYNPEQAGYTVDQRELPNVHSTLHPLNYKKFYKTTLQEKDLKLAFLTLDGVTNMRDKIIQQLYSSASEDEFNVMKYMIAKSVLGGFMYGKTIPATETDNLKKIVAAIKAVSNNIVFKKTQYNYAGVSTFTAKEDQYIIVNSDFDATIDVEVLAAAFNMDKTTFAGHKILVDSFGDINTWRLDALFKGEEWYTPLTDDEIAAVNQIPAVLIDKDWFFILDHFNEFYSRFNEEGLFYNYWYHVWKTFSTSPYANAIVFVPGKQSVNSVTVAPSSITINQKTVRELSFSAIVETVNFASKKVTWESSDDTAIQIDQNGHALINKDATDGDITITATSVFDNTKAGTATVTLASS